MANPLRGSPKAGGIHLYETRDEACAESLLGREVQRVTLPHLR